MQICTLEWDFFFFSFHHFHDKSRVDYINIIATRQFISRWLLLGLEKGGFFLLPSKTKWSDNYLAIWPALFDNNYSSFRRSPTNSGRLGLRVSPTTAGWGIIPSLSGRKNVAGAGSEGRGSGAAPLAAQGLHKSSTQPRWARGELFNKGRGERIALGVGEAFQTPGWKKKMSVPSAALLWDMNLTWLLVKCSFQVAGAGTAFCCAQLQISGLFHLYLFIYFGGEAEEFFEKDGTIKSG